MSEINVVSPMPTLLRRRSGLERMLKQINRDIEWLERKQALSEFVAADRINSGRTDIPSLAEVVEWDVRFRAEYRHMHEVRNDAILASTQDQTSRHVRIEAEKNETGQTIAEVLGEDDKIQALNTSIDNYVEDLAFMRGAGYEAAEPLVGQREPRLSTIHCPQDCKSVLAWWVGAYQRIGLL